MLARCVLADRARGGPSHWGGGGGGETLKIICARIKRWRAGDIPGLWLEVQDEQDRLSRRRKPKEFSESLRAANARRARLAMEDGQYKKASQALTSSGLARAYPEVHAEMLVNIHKMTLCQFLKIQSQPM